MNRYLLAVVVAAVALFSAAQAHAQHPRTRHSSGALEWYYRSGAQQNAATNAYVQGVVSGSLLRQPQGSYYSNSLYGPGYSYTTGRGPFGNFSQNTLYGNGYSYTSGYGVPWYGAAFGGYGFAPYGGFGAGY